MNAKQQNCTAFIKTHIIQMEKMPKQIERKIFETIRDSQSPPKSRPHESRPRELVREIRRFHDDLDLDGSICLCAHAFFILICRALSFLGLAGLFLFRLVLVALVVGDALVNAPTEMLCELLDLGLALLSVILVEVLFHDPVAALQELSIGIECCNYAAWIDGMF